MERTTYANYMTGITEDGWTLVATRPSAEAANAFADMLGHEFDERGLGDTLGVWVISGEDSGSTYLRSRE